MRSETAEFLSKAKRCLDRADVMLTVNLHDDAGRAAYFACFHASQAFIFENMEKVAKTLNGVRTEFLRLTKDDKRLDPGLGRFLIKSYEFKSAADYFTSGDELSAQQAIDSAATARRFVEQVMQLL